MAELRFLKGFSGQSTDELIGLYGRYRTDSLVLAFEQALQAKLTRHPLKLSDEERVVLAVEAFEREVNHGGFAYLFRYVSLDLTSILVEALERIGCPASAAIVRAAEAAHGLQDEDMRNAELGHCDDRFYAGHENIEEALFDFIKNHRTAIALTG